MKQRVYKDRMFSWWLFNYWLNYFFNSHSTSSRHVFQSNVRHFQSFYWNWCGTPCLQYVSKQMGTLLLCNRWQGTNELSMHTHTALSLCPLFTSWSPCNFSLLASVPLSHTHTHTHTQGLPYQPYQSSPWHWEGLQSLYEQLDIHLKAITATVSTSTQDISLSVLSVHAEIKTSKRSTESQSLLMFCNCFSCTQYKIWNIIINSKD